MFVCESEMHGKNESDLYFNPGFVQRVAPVETTKFYFLKKTVFC